MLAGRGAQRRKIFIIILRKSEIKFRIIYLYGTMIHEMIKLEISHKSNLKSGGWRKRERARNFIFQH